MKRIVLVLVTLILVVLSPTNASEFEQLNILLKSETHKSNTRKSATSNVKVHQLSTSRMQRIMNNDSKFGNFDKIVGGEEANKGEYPWAVSFAGVDVNGKLNSYCGGSLIGKKWILTAAHCEVLDSDYAIIGRHDLSSGAGNKYHIKRFIPHAGYDENTNDNDIALVELEKETKGNSFIQLNYKGSVTNTSVTVIGWGALSEGGLTSNTLQIVTIPIVDNKICKESYSNLTDNMLCAGEYEGGKDSCQGDSGGPLFVKIQSSLLQVGIVSFGEGCARPNYYGVYTRVYNYSKWIKDIVEDAS